LPINQRRNTRECVYLVRPTLVWPLCSRDFPEQNRRTDRQARPNALPLRIRDGNNHWLQVQSGFPSCFAVNHVPSPMSFLVNSAMHARLGWTRVDEVGSFCRRVSNGGQTWMSWSDVPVHWWTGTGPYTLTDGLSLCARKLITELRQRDFLSTIYFDKTMPQRRSANDSEYWRHN